MFLGQGTQPYAASRQGEEWICRPPAASPSPVQTRAVTSHAGAHRRQRLRCHPAQRLCLARRHPPEPCLPWTQTVQGAATRRQTQMGAAPGGMKQGRRQREVLHVAGEVLVQSLQHILGLPAGKTCLPQAALSLGMGDLCSGLGSSGWEGMGGPDGRGWSRVDLGAGSNQSLPGNWGGFGVQREEGERGWPGQSTTARIFWGRWWRSRHEEPTSPPPHRLCCHAPGVPAAARPPDREEARGWQHSAEEKRWGRGRGWLQSPLEADN